MESCKAWVENQVGELHKSRMVHKYQRVEGLEQSESFSVPSWGVPSLLSSLGAKLSLLTQQHIFFFFFCKHTSPAYKGLNTQQSKAQNKQLADPAGGKTRQVIGFLPHCQVLGAKVPGLFVLLPILVSLTKKQTFQSTSKKCFHRPTQTNSDLLREAQSQLIISSNFCYFLIRIFQ